MQLYPAIDLRGGSAVRLSQGDFARQVGYGDPLALAERFMAGGARWLHVVDLDAARTGTVHEVPLIDGIVHLAATHGGVQVQNGGGIRSEAIVASARQRGISRVVMGTAALHDPELANRCAAAWPGGVAVGLDYAVDESGAVQAMGQGWSEASGRSLAGLLDSWEGGPVAAVVATSIASDGMLGGPDLDGLRSLLQVTALPVIASGGVGSLADIAALAALSHRDRRLDGVIVGKALADGRFSVEEAIAACAPSA